MVNIFAGLKKIKSLQALITTIFILINILNTKAQTPFNCDHTMYLSNETSLYSYSTSGIQTYLFEVGNVNSLGFAKTGIMWAFDQTVGSKSVVTIDSSGIVTPIFIPDLPIPAGPNTNYNVGAIDTNGYYYLYDGETTARFYIIDTDPTRNTYGRLVDPTANGGIVPYPLDARTPKGTVISPAANGGANRRLISDWCVNPLDGRLYAMTNSASVRPYILVSYDPVTGQIQEHTSAITGDNIRNTPSYGAIFLDLLGNFYVFANQRGHLYSINVANSTARQLSTYSITSSNVDGANCILNERGLLPVKLLLFDVNIKDKTIQLNWSTASELNNQSFDIERSTDGLIWKKIGIVASQSLNGNSYTRLDYNFIDYAPSDDVNYYRLKQTDFDGQFEYSYIRKAIFTSSLPLKWHPNPVSDQIKIEGIENETRFRVYSISGMLVLDNSLPEGTQTIDLNRLASGVYYIQFSNESMQRTDKLIMR